MMPNPNSWVFDKWMESIPVKVGSFMPADKVALVHVVDKPIVLGPGQSSFDLAFEQQIERGIDWEATARHSVIITNIGEKSS